mmetsp:Transcript_11114/g.25176  ORF Transcript_11114/g.25176 Transcript_11114/m.25176 type:complete len:203 (+) Transcript_11114:410-1018(+)
MAHCFASAASSPSFPMSGAGQEEDAAIRNCCIASCSRRCGGSTSTAAVDLESNHASSGSTKQVITDMNPKFMATANRSLNGASKPHEKTDQQDMWWCPIMCNRTHTMAKVMKKGTKKPITQVRTKSASNTLLSQWYRKTNKQRRVQVTHLTTEVKSDVERSLSASASSTSKLLSGSTSGGTVEASGSGSSWYCNIIFAHFHT